jgi:uncharacterized iron-regulated membrane protein
MYVRVGPSCVWRREATLLTSVFAVISLLLLGCGGPFAVAISNKVTPTANSSHATPSSIVEASPTKARSGSTAGPGTRPTAIPESTSIPQSKSTASPVSVPQPTTTPIQYDVAGQWTTYDHLQQAPDVLTLEQNGSSISGTGLYDNSYPETVSGTINGASVHIVVTPTGLPGNENCTATYDVTLDNSSASMTGPATFACNSNENGIYTLTRT